MPNYTGKSLKARKAIGVAAAAGGEENEAEKNKRLMLL